MWIASKRKNSSSNTTTLLRSWRHSYLHNFHRADWNDPLLYDLTINTGRMDREDAVNRAMKSSPPADENPSYDSSDCSPSPTPTPPE